MTEQTRLSDFEAIFHQYKGWVYKTAYLIVGDMHKAEDIMQEVFVRAYKSNGTFDPEKSSYKNWLRRIAINQCIDSNSKKGPASLSIEEMEEQGQYLLDISLPFTEKISFRDDIRHLLNSLDIKYRAAIVLRCIDGYTYDEIAKLLGIPVGTAKTRVSRATRALRERQKKLEK